MFTPCYIRQCIRDLRDHCTIEEIAAFVGISTKDVNEHMNTLPAYNDEAMVKLKHTVMILRRKEAEKVNLVRELLRSGMKMSAIAREIGLGEREATRITQRIAQMKEEEEMGRFRRAYRHSTGARVHRLVSGAAEYERKCEEEARRIYGTN